MENAMIRYGRLLVVPILPVLAFCFALFLFISKLSNPGTFEHSPFFFLHKMAWHDVT